MRTKRNYKKLPDFENKTNKNNFGAKKSILDQICLL